MAAANAKALREAERLERQQAAYEEKERKRLYLEDRQDEVENLNQELASTLADMKGILEHTLKIDDRLDFDSLRIKKRFPAFSPPAELTEENPAPTLESFTCRVTVPGFIGRRLSWVQKNYEKNLAAAKSQHESGLAEHEKEEAERKEKLASLKAAYDRDKEAFLAKVKQRDMEVDELQARYAQGGEDAVEAYNTTILERSSYPDGFPQEFLLLYQADPKQVIIEYRLPDISVVPTAAEYSYVKSKERPMHGIPCERAL